jgi:hypothetical protein
MPDNFVDLTESPAKKKAILPICNVSLIYLTVILFKLLNSN